MSAAKVKARRMWGPKELLVGAVFCISRALRRTYAKRGVTPYYVLPADADSIERMVEQMARAMCGNDFSNEGDGAKLYLLDDWRAESYRDQARAALAAIGVKDKGGSRK